MGERLRAPSLAHPLLLCRLGKRALTGDYILHGDPERVVCAIVYSFGRQFTQGEYQPGTSNEALAKLAARLFPDRTPILAQWEVYRALQVLGRDAICIGRYGQNMHTQHVSVGAVAAMRQAKMLRAGVQVAVVAKPEHMPRADANLQAALPDDMETAASPGYEIPWDTESAQSWTRNLAGWEKREWRAIASFAALGWIDLRHEAAV